MKKMSERGAAGDPEGPEAVLGVSLEATDKEIRAAYLEKIKQHPPDRDPVRFERVRDAYQALRDPRRRMQRMLLEADPETPFAALLRARPRESRFVGPGPWLDVLKER